MNFQHRNLRDHALRPFRALRAGDASSTESGRWAVLRPGRNCLRVAAAARASVLIDAGAYFARLEQTLRRARHTITIVGWDFDASIRLRADVAGSPSLGDLLRSLVEAEPELEIRVLVWSLAVIHTPSAALPLLLGEDWQDHPRIHVRLDREHPIYAAHHQKIVVVDDAVAFVGGIDLTIERWDTCAHAAHDAHRRKPDGSIYHPVHDLQMAVEGPAAATVGEVARERWRVATGETLPPSPPGNSPWPEDLAADFVDTHVAVARTAPPWGKARPVHEAAALTTDCLAAARRCIYMEAQYLTEPSVGRLLRRKLRAPDGPEIVILVTGASPGALERFIMGSNRDRMIRRLMRADRHGRLRILHPVVPDGPGECGVQIHSKLIIVDNFFLRIGSSNLNNRSVGLDTECDLAIEAASQAEKAAIRRLRDTLLAEHLDTDPAAVEAAVEDAGSLVGGLDRLNTGRRGLRPFAVPRRGPILPIPLTWLLDPRRPFEPTWFLRHRRGRRRAPA